MEIYERLSKTKTTAPDDVLMRLGRAARAAGDPDKAADAFSRVVLRVSRSAICPRWPSRELESLPNAAPVDERLAALQAGARARRAAVRRQAVRAGAHGVRSLRAAAQGDDRELVNLRLAECDYFLKRTRNARDEVRPFIDKASRQGEALFFYALTERELGDSDEYVQTIRRLVDEFPAQSWAEEALNNLASYYIVQDDDEAADETFREMYAKFPTGRYAERAAWKIGWSAYRNGRYAETTQLFETAASTFPRSDYRPSWLYWSARAHEALKETSAAEARYTLVAADYLNSYYGRLAVTHLGRGARAPSPTSGRREAAAPGAGAAAAERAGDSGAAGARAVRPGARRAALRAEDLGRFGRHPGDDRLDLSRTRRPARRHQRDEAGLSAVHGGGRRKAAARAAQGAVPGELLAADPPLFRRAPARSVHDRGADRAGVDVHRRRQVGGERVRADAARSRHRPPVREDAAALEALFPSSC